MLVPVSQNRGSVVDKLRVPIYSLSSWSSIVSLKAAMFVDPIRDVYEVRIDPP
jgi:Organic solute transporter Ostalpha